MKKKRVKGVKRSTVSTPHAMRLAGYETYTDACLEWSTEQNTSCIHSLVGTMRMYHILFYTIEIELIWTRMFRFEP